jgi:hypothetical protein
MANITTSVSNLVQGVSQQSPKVRFVGQCEEQINALSSVSDGLKKRPCTRVISNLYDTVIHPTDYVHFINRSETERYAVVLNSTVARAFNLDDGTEASINGTTGGLELPEYLQSSYARKYMKAMSLADTTFFLNTQVIPAMTSELTDPEGDSKALVFIKQGDYKKKYELIFNGSGAARAEVAITWNGIGDDWEIESIQIIKSGLGYSTSFTPVLEILKIVSRTGRMVTAPVFNITVNDATTQISNIAVVDGGYFTTRNFEPLMSFPESAAGSSAITFTSGDSTSASNADTSVIATGLNALIDANTVLLANYIHYVNGSSIVVDQVNKKTFYLTSQDGLANQAIGVVFKTVDDISDLPIQAPNNFTVKVRGAIDNKEDDYYVKFKTNDSSTFGTGGWVEDVGYGIAYKLDGTTMPYQLVNDGLNSFTLSHAPWTNRIAGDDDSNPLPSFIGKPINNLFFFKNRLGLLTDDTVLFSEAGQFFNFFRTTVRTLLDSDPIDVSAASTTISKLSSAVAFQENLILFADRGQFVVKSGDTLTSKNISITAITNYDVDTSAEPMGLGSYVYFPFSRGNYLGIREFKLDAASSTYDSADITSQIPSYITSGVTTKIVASSTENLICVLTQDAIANTIYVYKFYWSGNEKVISSWSKFTFAMDIQGIEFMNSKLYIVGNKNGNAILTFINMEEQRSELDTTGNFSYHLDLLTKVTSGPTNSITLPYHVSNGDIVEAYDENGINAKISHIVGNTVYLKRPATCFIGIRYNMEYTFSEPTFKQQGGPQGTPSGLTRFILRNGTVFYSNAASFRIEVTPVARDTITLDFSPSIIDVTRTGSMIFKDGSARFSIFTEAKDCVIKIINDSAFSANFQSAEFEANAHTRSSRYS